MIESDDFDESHRRAHLARELALYRLQQERRRSLIEMSYVLIGVGALLAIAAVCVWGGR